MIKKALAAILIVLLFALTLTIEYKFKLYSELFKEENTNRNQRYINHKVESLFSSEEISKDQINELYLELLVDGQNTSSFTISDKRYSLNLIAESWKESLITDSYDVFN